jgi:DNA (cytosine-5)-methyltransferase 1
MIAVDLFCGAGGFSEGILQAGFHIVFSSDRSEHVKETYEHRHKQLGLIQGENTHFELADVRDLTGEKIITKINELEIFIDNPLLEIDAIFGGPPCQGFSIAGKRDKDDPRNTLFREYIRIISEVNPKYVVIENVEGFMSMELNDGFISVSGNVYTNHARVSDVLKSELEYLGYHVETPKLLNASDYGVPQRRVRAIFIASRLDMVPAVYPEPTTKEISDKVTVKDAIGDLISSDYLSTYALSLKSGRTPHFITKKPISNFTETLNNEKSKHSKVIEERFSLFSQGESAKHIVARIAMNGIDLNNYPNLLNECLFVANKLSNFKEFSASLHRVKPDFYIDSEKKSKRINSLFNKLSKIYLLNEKAVNYENQIMKVAREFNLSLDEIKKILLECKQKWNKEMSKEYLLDLFKNNPEVVTKNLLMESLLTKKNTRSRLDSEGTAPTMLTLPDDFIHPFENRILTVREMGRLQSFDESFSFQGKRTTGGERRKDEVPQYSQVGNAVPPLLAYAIAMEIKKAILKTNASSKKEEENNQLV